MIELRNITKQFGDRTVLHGIDVSIRRGEMTFITGTSGAGKTTLLNIIGGLDCPTSGSMKYCGRDVSTNLCEFRAETVGVVFQDNNLISGLNAASNVLVAAGIVGREPPVAEAEKSLREIGITNPQQKAETLSGGEKQRVSVLRSMLKKADVLIADEPTGSLDSTNATLVFDMLESLKQGRHIIVVSHDKEMAEHYADRILVLRDGEIAEDILKKETLTDEDDCDDKTSSGEFESTASVRVEHAAGRVVGSTARLLGKNSVSQRKGRFLLLALSLALSITALSAVIILRRAGQALYDEVNVNYMEGDWLKVAYGFYPNTGYGSKPFTQEEIEQLKRDGDVAEIVERYYVAEDTDFFFWTENGNSTKVDVRQILTDDFFRDRVMTNDITGGFPEKDDEVILAEDAATALFGERNAIGETVWVHCEASSDLHLTVVGINHTKNPHDTIYTFVCSGLFKTMLEDELKSNRNRMNFALEWETEVKMGGDSRRGLKFNQMGSVSGDEELLYGKQPVTPDEVLISSALFSVASDEFGISGEILENDLIERRLSAESVQKAFEHLFALDYNGVFPIKCVGVYKADTMEIRITEERMKDLLHADPIMLDVYIKNARDMGKIKSQWSKAYPEYVITAEQETMKTKIESQNTLFETAILILGVILALVSVAMLASYAKLMLGERRNEIAVIKSFGAKDSVLFRVLSYDFVAVSFCASVLAIVLTLIAKGIGGTHISQLKLIGLDQTVLVAAGIGLAFLAVNLLATWLLMRKTVRKMPSELLRKG